MSLASGDPRHGTQNGRWKRATRAEKVALVRETQTDHPAWTRRQVADHLGISIYALNGLLNDPDGSKQRARRDSYDGVCSDCGGPTKSDGTSNPSPRCFRCQKTLEHNARYWNQERIIAALHEFRARVGRQPTAADLLIRSGAPSIERHLSAERAAESVAIPGDVVLPAHVIVCREFGSWSAALAAAGMAPNKTGGAGHRKPKGGVVRQYVVFSKNGAGWIPRETVDARDESDAIQRVADGEGAYVAVPIQHWQERTVAPKTVFAVVDDA